VLRRVVLRRTVRVVSAGTEEEEEMMWQGARTLLLRALREHAVLLPDDRAHASSPTDPE